ncbi:MAG: hydroxymethylbilane synthase [Rhodovarius sp.]|nr:hydroxymethylbilane synthase [Rhodovarius sp.]
MESATAARAGMRAHGRMPGLPLRVGTRGSPLALVQTRQFLAQLTRICPVLQNMGAFEEHPITTTGDRIQHRALAEIGGKGLFAKEIHEALLDRRIDFAVHSLKDLETELPPGILLACTLAREDARDALLIGPPAAVDPADPLRAIPPGAVVGSASLRRQAQLLARRPDLRVVHFRGNVEGRIAKLRAGEVGATLLALAGLKRLGREGEATAILPTELMLPAACQGIVGITVRAADEELAELLSAIEDPAAAAVSRAERALLAALDGNCRTPIAGHATLLPGGRLRLEGLTARADGSFLLRRTIEGPASEAAALGTALGQELRRDSPADIFG